TDRGATPTTPPTDTGYTFAKNANSGTIPARAGSAAHTLYTLGDLTVAAPAGGAGTAWKDVLRLLWTGIDKAGATNCGSAARRDLAEGYASFSNGGCTSGSCGAIKHVFRRGDLSGMTDTFLALINAPSIAKDANGQATGTPFCNGLDNDDNDPIRRP